MDKVIDMPLVANKGEYFVWLSYNIDFIPRKRKLGYYQYEDIKNGIYNDLGPAGDFTKRFEISEMGEVLSNLIKFKPKELNSDINVKFFRITSHSVENTFVIATDPDYDFTIKHGEL